MEIELSVTFTPELTEAVREAADGAGLSLSEWLSQAAEAKLNADRDAAILAAAGHERRMEAVREALDEYQAEHGAFTDEELAEASRKLGWPWPPEGDDDERPSVCRGRADRDRPRRSRCVV